MGKPYYIGKIDLSFIKSAGLQLAAATPRA
jgi:hypothetical protein